ncbi:MAG: hypothetical protein QXP53_01965 [Candidatus Pacearchaeota archaeon]
MKKSKSKEAERKQLALEKEVFKQNLKEAIEEAKKPKPGGASYGIAGVVIGVIGLFLPWIFSILVGFVAIILGLYSIHSGKKTLGIICIILGMIDAIFLFFGILRFQP